MNIYTNIHIITTKMIKNMVENVVFLYQEVLSLF